MRVCWVWVIACAWGQDTPPADALAEVASRCDAASVRLLLERGVNPNAHDKNGETALTRALNFSSRCDASLVQLLLDKGADVNLPASRGDTPLLRAVTGYASERGIIRASVPVVQLLLDRGAIADARSMTTLVNQFTEHVEVMRLLLDHGAPATEEALRLAVRRGHADEVTLLLDRGLSGQTALIEAAQAERDPQNEVLKRLLARGVRDGTDHAAAQAAASAGYPDRVVLLKGPNSVRQQALDRGLLRSIREGDPDGAANLVRQGADPNAKSEEGSPALTLAAARTFTEELIKLMLDRGARIDATDAEGHTALMIAVERFEMKTVRLLLVHKASVKWADRKGNTALLAAACASAFPDGRAALVELLLEHGADARVRNADGANAVMLAARCGNLALPALVKNGADVNAADKDGRTALMVAVTKGDEEVVRFLVDNGADVRARDHAGRSVLLIAIDAPPNFSYDNQIRYSYQITSLLVEKGADVQAAAADGDTPLLAARRRDHQDMVRLLETHQR